MVLLVPSAGHAAAPASPEKTLAQELSDLDLPPLPASELTGNVRASAGYNDNVLLSAVRREESSFVRAETEMLWWRFPTERFEALVFANGALTRFFESDENPEEWEAFARGEARWFLAKTLRAAGVVEGYSTNRSLDFSLSASALEATRMKVVGGGTSAALRWSASPRFWVEAEPGFLREKFHDGSDDNQQNSARLALGGLTRSERVEASGSFKFTQLDFDHRRQFDRAGAELAGTNLVFHQREVRAQIAVAWDAASQWRTATEAGMTWNDDGGSGYFDYRLSQARQEINWTRAPWRVRVIARVGRYDYDVQTVANGGARYRRETLVRARVERQLGLESPHTLFAEYSTEDSRSNDPLATYRANTALAGLDWRW
jgi:hypothetical protein